MQINSINAQNQMQKQNVSFGLKFNPNLAAMGLSESANKVIRVFSSEVKALPQNMAGHLRRKSKDSVNLVIHAGPLDIKGPFTGTVEVAKITIDNLREALKRAMAIATEKMEAKQVL